MDASQESELQASPGSSALASRRAKLVTASVNFGLTAYATLTVAAIKMLHCVWVPGTPLTQRRLFVRASVVCSFSGWQAPYVLLVVLLVTVPALLPFAAAWSRKPGGTAWDQDVRVGVRRALVDCYHPKAYWWEAALMAQRLVRRCLSAVSPPHTRAHACAHTLAPHSLVITWHCFGLPTIPPFPRPIGLLVLRSALAWR